MMATTPHTGGGSAAGPVIECSNAARYFLSGGEEVKALDGVTVTAQPGTLTCLYGASGSGKSTLLNLMAGLDVATTGYVRALDTNLGELGERQRAAFRLQHIGVVFQDNNLINEFDAVENVMLPLQATGRSAKDARETAMAALERVGVAGQAKRRPNKMSGGQRQRVGIARALAGGKSVMLADEPTGALDTTNSRALFEVIRSLCEAGATAVVATHDPMAREYATSVLELQDGRAC